MVTWRVMRRRTVRGVTTRDLDSLAVGSLAHADEPAAQAHLDPPGGNPYPLDDAVAAQLVDDLGKGNRRDRRESDAN